VLVLVGKHPSQFQSRLGGQAQPTLRRAMPAADARRHRRTEKPTTREVRSKTRRRNARWGRAWAQRRGAGAPAIARGRVQGKAGGCRRHACSARRHRPRRHRPRTRPPSHLARITCSDGHTCGCRAMASGCPAARRAGLKLLPSMPAIAPATGFPPPVLAFPPFLPPTSYFFFPGNMVRACRSYVLMVRDCRSLDFVSDGSGALLSGHEADAQGGRGRPAIGGGS